MTIATLRSDGFPQATTVSYANDGLTVYFGTAGASQKAHNIAQNNKVSLTVNLPYTNWGQIRGLSMAGRAERLSEEQQIAHAGELLLRKFPQGIAEYASGALDGVALFRITPEVISVLDYRKGFGHTDLVQVSEADRGTTICMDEQSDSPCPSGFDVSPSTTS
jgi:nitroimidazol reductase NimA-like FMN-containing flavoprotein (pyridoxamine 5'-phosphate oxidase superfamily)